MKKIYQKNNDFDPLYDDGMFLYVFKRYFLSVFAIFLGFYIFISQIFFPLYSFSSEKVNEVSGFQEFEFKELKNFEISTNVLGDSTEIPEFFYISIPKLKIVDAKVETNADSLSPDLALGHYPNTALPGQTGTTFIFGHSVLPMFYNPKNYKTIFSKIGDLDVGDEFTITYNNKTLSYTVTGKRDLYPKEVNPLEEISPRYLNESNVVLMTCSPPGTKIKRLLVEAELRN